MKKGIVFILVGVLNILHFSTHILQSIQSFVMVSSIHHHNHDHDNWFIEIMESPYMMLVWGIVGIVSLIIGIKDFIHHKKCKH